MRLGRYLLDGPSTFTCGRLEVDCSKSVPYTGPFYIEIEASFLFDGSFVLHHYHDLIFKYLRMIISANFISSKCVNKLEIFKTVFLEYILIKKVSKKLEK